LHLTNVGYLVNSFGIQRISNKRVKKVEINSAASSGGPAWGSTVKFER